MIIGDAHEYLLKHYKEFDFIWSSPPCQTHSRARFWGSKGGMCNVKYPDMKLWQEIIFLKHYVNCKWVVENVKPFYENDLSGFMKPDAELARHLFWSNFKIRNGIDFEDGNIQRYKVKEFQDLHGLEIRGKKLSTRRDQVLRNCV